MKEIYYGRIPLGVPIQKRPPDKYASHPYPFLLNDAYNITAKPSSITIKKILSKVYESDNYQASVTPLGIKLKEPIVVLNGLEPQYYLASVKPLNIKLKEPIIVLDGLESQYYLASVQPLNIIIKQILIKYIQDDFEAYQASVNPLNITLG